MQRLDRVTFELAKNHIDAIVDEMTLTIVRTAYSTTVREGMDFSAAICDAKGQMVGQGVCIALHLGSIPDAIGAVFAKFGDRIEPGDVFILNDPYCGGMHLPDIFLFKPVFVEGTLLAFLVLVADHLDIGGKTPGGRSVNSTEVFQEGLRIPPLKLFEAGKSVPAIWDIIGQNVRVPHKVFGDLRSCLAAFHSAERMLPGVVAKFGLAAIQGYFQETLDYTEQMTRQLIASLPDGHYEFTDYIDDAIVNDDPVKIHIALDVVGDELSFDLAGTSAQVPAAINATMSFTKSAIYAVVRTLLPSDLPNNAGLFRPITVTAPLGTIVNPREPAPVASRGVTGFRVADAALGVLAQVAPDRVPAACEGGATSMRFGGIFGERGALIVRDAIGGTRGARPDRDGIDGCSNFTANTANAPIEVIESEFPVRIRRYGFQPDSAGPGKYRGGLGLEKEWELMEGEAVMTVRADRTRFLPWGLQGGKPGVLGRNILNPHENPKVLPAKVNYQLQRGDRFLHQQASGGGYGDPLERDPEVVLQDWLNEVVSTAHAREAYGVVIDEENQRVDAEATVRLRAARGGTMEG